MAINPVSYPTPQAYSGGADFSMLANLGNVYREAQKREQLADLGKKIASGEIDYKQAAGLIGQTGDVGSALKFLELGEARRLQDLQVQASADFAKGMQGMYGGGGGPAPPARAAAPEPEQTAAVPARVPVDEIPGVVRQNPDGTIAGNITSPTIPAPAAAPGTPLPAARPAGPPAVGQGDVTLQPPPIPRDQAALPPSVSAANAGAIGALPAEQRVPILIRAASSPFLPTPQRDVAKALLTDALGELKPHERVKYLQAIKDDDPTLANKSLYQIETDLKKAAATTVSLAGETAQAKRSGEELADIKMAQIKQGLKVPKLLGTLDVMERAAQDPNFFSGTNIGSQAVLSWKRALAAVGGPEFDEKAKPTEVFQKASNQLVTEVLSGDKGGSGLGTGVSNADRDFIRDTAPNLANSKEGNLALIQMHRMLAQREAVIAKMTRDYANAHGGAIDYNFLDQVAKFQEANPIFKDFKLDTKALKQQAPQGGGGWSQQEIEAEMQRRKSKQP